MSTLIKGGTIVTASETYQADVLIEGEQIVTIGHGLAGDTTIDASGKYVIPGGIDVHTHLDMPFGGTVSSDDFFTGHQAAAFGGTTMHIDFAIQPKGATLRETLDIWQAKAEGKAAVDYGFHVAITDLPDNVMDEIKHCPDYGVTSLKLFMAYKGVLQVDDAHAVPRDAAGRRARAADHGPCRERRRDRHPGQGGGRGRQPGAEVPRADPPARAGGRGDQPRHPAGRGGRRAAVRGPPDQRTARWRRCGWRARAAAAARSSPRPACSISFSPRTTWRGPASRAPSGSARRRTASQSDQDGALAAAWPTTRSR